LHSLMVTRGGRESRILQWVKESKRHPSNRVSPSCDAFLLYCS
jgi:hypothetical protein